MIPWWDLTTFDLQQPEWCSFFRVILLPTRSFSLSRLSFINLIVVRRGVSSETSITMRNIAISTLIVASSAFLVYSFPDGAPVDTCVKPSKANEPNHGQATSEPPHTSPYAFTASSSEYGPGSQITVTISGSPFKGFFLQARDPDTDSWIGSWAQTENTNTHPECSAVTHADPYVKQHATLIWNAPPNARGRVYFTGTILKEYAKYWSSLVATTKN